MADNFSDIMSNYKSMSVEELGNSLLKRQEDINKRNAKRARKNERIQQALALMLTGQAVFKGAYKRREEELKAAQTWEARDNESQSAQINALSNLMPVIPENFHEDKTAEERAALFMANPEYRNRLNANMRNYINANLAKIYPADMQKFEGTAAYSRLVNQAGVEIMTNFFSKDDQGVERWKNFDNQLRQIFNEKDMDRLDLYLKGSTLEETELSDFEAQTYAAMKRQLRNKSDIVGGLKEMFQRFSKDDKAKGGIGLFSTIDEQHLAYPQLNEVLDALDLRGIVIPALKEGIAEMYSSPTFYRDAANSEQNAGLKTAIETELGNMSQLIKSDKVSFDSEGLLRTGLDQSFLPDRGARAKDRTNIVVEEDFEKFVEWINEQENSGVKEDYLNEVTGLILRLREDPNLARSLYFPFAKDKEELDRFETLIQGEQFARQFAIALVAKENFQYDNIIRPGDWDSYQSQGLDMASYRPSAEMNVLLGASKIVVMQDNDGRDKFVGTDEYNEAPDRIKKLLYDNTIRSIIEAPEDKLSELEKQKTLDNLFTNLPNPRGLNQVDYLQKMAEERAAYNRMIMANPMGGYALPSMIQDTPVADFLKKKDLTNPTESNIEVLSKPYTTEKMNENIVSDALDIATSISSQSDAYNQTVKKFLMMTSNYESDFGQNENTFRTDPDRATGFTQMIPNESILEVKRVLNPVTADGVGATVRKYNEMIIEKLGPEYDLNKIAGDLKVIDKDNYELINYNSKDMEDPLKHALMARAYLLRLPTLPNDEEAWGQYYQDEWNTGDDYGDHVARFNFKNSMYLRAAKEFTKDMLGID